MLELDEAQQRILAKIPPAASELIPLADAHGRILAERVVSSLDLPLFDNSSMDGYAVRAADVANARPQSPVPLTLAGRVAAGEAFKGQLGAGYCVRLFTGSPLPTGSDAVVMQEDTRLADASHDQVLILDAAKPWENVRLRGEDIRRGDCLVEPGTLLTVGRTSVLAATGCAEVSVGRRPIVALLATGSELREPGQPLAACQIYESNRLGLAALVRSTGADARVFPLVPDTLEATRSAIEAALAACDIVITSGGVSVGELDFVKRAFGDLGGEMQFWKVAIKPGRPFMFGARQGKFLFGLPGNPVSALVTFLLLVRPALLRWQGAAEVDLPTHPGTLAEPLMNDGQRRHFMRVHVDAGGKVRSSGLQASHALSSLAAANGLVDVPPQTTLPPRASVTVLRWE